MRALIAFGANLGEIDRLLEIHTTEGGGGRGRKHRLEVVNKAAIVLITAFWEAFCEDAASEAIDHILQHTDDPDLLPAHLRNRIAAEIKKAPHDLEPWKLAGGGWKAYVRERSARLTEERNRKLNTPKAAQIDALFEEAIGIQKISSRWKLSKRTTVERTREMLDDFVSLRGAIAHRGNNDKAVRKSDVMAYTRLVIKIAVDVDLFLDKQLLDWTGVSPTVFV